MMKLNPLYFAVPLLALALGSNAAQADESDATSPAIAAKLILRSEPNGLKVSEMRLTRKNDVLVVQADLQNVTKKDVVAYHRFRWLDASGNQVGDGESWKQTPVAGKQIATVNSVAPTSAVVDLRLEMNVEKK
jgi:uncharacterized protein YcfL